MYTPPPRLTFLQKVRIVWLTFLDTRTSFPAKMILGGGVLYGLMPLDLIPDVLPVIGFSDDAIILILTLFAFFKMTKAIQTELQNRERYQSKDSRP